MENLRKTIGENLTKLRKAEGLTQAELGEKFSYTDRAVSKWENGDTLPDIETLDKLAKYYGVTVDFLLEDHLDEDIILKKDQKIQFRNHIIITILMSTIVWMIATFVFVYTMIYIETSPYWLAFVWAIPLNGLLLVFFNKYYFKSKWVYFISVSLIVWSILTGIYFQLCYFGNLHYGDLWPIFLLGVPMQIALGLYVNIKRRPTKVNEKNN